MSKSYAIINESNIAMFFTTGNEKNAIVEYASYVGLKIRKTIFCKAIMSLSVDETAELFNDVCLSDGDAIRMLLSDFSVVYGGENNAD